jgi:hypothetical protein
MHSLSTTKQTITALQDTNERNRKKAIENFENIKEKDYFIPSKGITNWLYSLLLDMNNCI